MPDCVKRALTRRVIQNNVYMLHSVAFPSEERGDQPSIGQMRMLGSIIAGIIELLVVFGVPIPRSSLDTGGDASARHDLVKVPPRPARLAQRAPETESQFDGPKTHNHGSTGGRSKGGRIRNG